MVIHSLQNERGTTTLQIGSKQFNFAKKRLELDEIRYKTNESIIGILESGYDSLFNGKEETFKHDLDNFRHKFDNGEINYAESFLTYSKWIAEFISTFTNCTKPRNFGEYANLYFAYNMIILSKDEAGLERDFGVLKFTEGSNFSDVITEWYNKKRFLADTYLTIGFLFSTELVKLHSSVFTNSSHLRKKITQKGIISSVGAQNTSSVKEAHEWFDLMTSYINLMFELQLRQGDLLKVKVKDKLVGSKNQLLTRALLLCFTLIVAPLIYAYLVRAQKTFYQYAVSLFDKVGLEQARTVFLMQENSKHVQSKLSEHWRGID